MAKRFTQPAAPARPKEPSHFSTGSAILDRQTSRTPCLFEGGGDADVPGEGTKLHFVYLHGARHEHVSTTADGVWVYRKS